MPFYFRKSVNAGPFRFNFSKSGVGISVGVKGLRVGTGPRGHYVQAGRGGFYYRASLGGERARRQPPFAASGRPPVAPPLHTADDMIAVTSSNVLAMQDSAFADVLADLNQKHGQMRMSTTLLLASAVLAVLVSASIGAGAVGIFLLVPIAWAVGAWFDSFKRVAVLFYDVEDDAQRRFTAICAAFDALASCEGKWHIEAGKAVHDLTTWKQQAGASHLVRRNATTLNYRLPQVLRCNVTPPAFQVGKRTIYLLPDVALIHDASGFGAVSYHALQVNWQPSNFIETDQVPRDAEIGSYTWEHPNKSGGPDRRFKSNKRLPVCRYEAMHLASTSGMNELLEFSRRGFVQPLVDAFQAMPENSEIDAIRALPKH